MLRDFRTKPQSKLQWVLWWRVDQDELQDQIAKYDTLGWLDSARKLSTLCLLFSATITIAFVIFKLAPAASYFDAALFAILAAFIYHGHRWAMIAAMALWTFDKILVVWGGLRTLGPSSGSIIVSFFWWAVYMHAFYLAFRVEQQKKKQVTTTTISQV